MSAWAGVTHAGARNVRAPSKMSSTSPVATRGSSKEAAPAAGGHADPLGGVGGTEGSVVPCELGVRTRQLLQPGAVGEPPVQHRLVSDEAHLPALLWGGFWSGKTT